MKRLNQKQKRYQQRRAEKAAGHRSARKKQKLSVPRDADAYRTDRSKVVRSPQVAKRPAEVILQLPENLTLTTNYDGVMNFLNKFRQVGLIEKRRLYIDFRPVQSVGPAAALLLAAELDRWRRITKHRLELRDATEWNPDVFWLLDEMGMYDLLLLANRPWSDEGNREQRFIKFRANRQVVGDLAKELKADLEAVLGHDRFAHNMVFYGALVEAMANVRDHAYPADFPPNLAPHLGMWWMSGSLDHKKKLLTVLFYDQGVGIPSTLPRLHPLERISGFLGKIGLGDDDASRIMAAFELGKTQSGETHRGLGLWKNVRAYVSEGRADRLRILSDRGEYIYYADGSHKLETRGISLGGTLIQWDHSI